MFFSVKYYCSIILGFLFILYIVHIAKVLCVMDIDCAQIVLAGLPASCCWEPAVPIFYRLRAVKLLLLDFVVPLGGWEAAFGSVGWFL